MMSMQATPAEASTEIELWLGADPVVRSVVSDPSLRTTQGPRPYLHPVRTAAGVVVTDSAPEDHPWHLGVSVALQDVAKTNFWGGRTFLREGGPTWQADHGRIDRSRLLAARPDLRRPEEIEEELHWRSPTGGLQLVERRRIAVRPADTSNAWVLDFAFTLTNATEAEIELGSPATNGKAGGGYGGFFWRLPASTIAPTVFTAEASGENGVHESTADWLAVHGHGLHGAGYTLVFLAGDARTAADPWFVRIADYPGIGSSLAVDEPIRLAPADTLARRLLIVVSDGHLDTDGAAQAAAAAVSCLG
ncbi:PmoA family protein [Actinoalloteichus sp. GBA129-24]|uniref:DUF6807 domain-containing protein n=1 Tax=Actinoalloteichus sp. GBA129-24 TaxID=1612551 RepID=UPI0018DBB21A|nr:PmoA family protein [Actinoalloteichus sp. GBA129-24]